jgi:hypothetical protein
MGKETDAPQLGLPVWRCLHTEDGDGKMTTTATREGCRCPACRDGLRHYSDCAVHNEPAEPCDCSLPSEQLRNMHVALSAYSYAGKLTSQDGTFSTNDGGALARKALADVGLAPLHHSQLGAKLGQTPTWRCPDCSGVSGCATCRGTGVLPVGSDCNAHPDAPHGFNRNASHNAGRYVCECEGWTPE